MTNSIREIRDADCILVIGSNTGESHPIISYEVVRAVKRGATLIVIDPRKISLVRHAALHLRPAPGTDHALYMGMLHTILAHGWHDQEFIAARTEGFDDLATSLQPWAPAAATAAAGGRGGAGKVRRGVDPTPGEARAARPPHVARPDLHRDAARRRVGADQGDVHHRRERGGGLPPPPPRGGRPA